MTWAALRRLRAAIDSRPRLALAVKAAIAAALSWLCIQPLGGIADDYPYYAPLGAVVAVTSTFASSVRSSARAIGAITAGAAIATLARLIPMPQYAALATVIAAGTLLGGWRRLGDMGSWVPISGLFVLILGGGDPAHYVAAYLGLTSVGAFIGILVNGVFPPLPLTATSLTMRRVRSMLADQLQDLADGLSQPAPPDAGDWQRRRLDLAPYVAEMHRLAQQVAESRQGNWRASHWRETADVQRRHARTLGRLSGLVEELVELLVERERAEDTEVALGPQLRPVTARGLAAMAAVLRATPGEDEWEESFAALTERIEDLRASTRTAWRENQEDRFTAAAIIVELERAAESLQETAESRVGRQASSSD